MRTDVTEQEVREHPLLGKHWYLMNEHYAGAGPAMCARLEPLDDFRGVVLTWEMLVAVSELFGTRNINIETELDGPYSDITPGNGPGLSIAIRPDL